MHEALGLIQYIYPRALAFCLSQFAQSARTALSKANKKGRNESRVQEAKPFYQLLRGLGQSSDHHPSISRL